LHSQRPIFFAAEKIDIIFRQAIAGRRENGVLFAGSGVRLEDAGSGAANCDSSRSLRPGLVRLRLLIKQSIPVERQFCKLNQISANSVPPLAAEQFASIMRRRRFAPECRQTSTASSAQRDVTQIVRRKQGRTNIIIAQMPGYSTRRLRWNEGEVR
jgi:hypothetical protein